MGEMKPTPGPWITHREGFSTIYIQASIGGGWVQEIAACGPTNDGSAQQEANARLIAEAGTVFHNTGLSPVQLLDLLKVIIAAADSELAQGGEMWFAEAVAPVIDDARAALAKCEGVGNDRA